MTDAELEERRTYTWLGKTHEIAAAHMSDIEVAGEVRMLMRDQLDHEAVCCTARDRIVCLHEEKQALISAIRSLREEKAARDRVVEAARAKLAAEDKVNANIAYGEQDVADARAHGDADKEFRAALAALEEQS